MTKTTKNGIFMLFIKENGIKSNKSLTQKNPRLTKIYIYFAKIILFTTKYLFVISFSIDQKSNLSVVISYIKNYTTNYINKRSFYCTKKAVALIFSVIDNR